MPQRTAPTKVPAIARPRVADLEMQRFVDAVVENLEVRNGIRGDRADRGVTFRDLDDAMASAVKDSATMDAIPAPVGFKADGGVGFVTLRWVVPQYDQHHETEVWRLDADEDGKLPPCPGSGKCLPPEEAVQVGSAIKYAYLDMLGFLKKARYWIRYVNVQGKKGPWSDPAEATTKALPEDTDEWDTQWFEDWLSEHPLFQAITSPIDPLPIPQIPSASLIRLRDIMRQWGMFFTGMDKHVDAGSRTTEELLFGEGQAGIERRDALYAKYGSRVSAVEFTEKAAATERDASASMGARLVAALQGLDGSGYEAVYNSLVSGTATEYNTVLETIEEGMTTFGGPGGSLSLFAESMKSFADEIEAVVTRHSQLFAQYGGTCAEGDDGPTYGDPKTIQSVEEYSGLGDALDFKGHARVNCNGHGLEIGNFVLMEGTTSGGYNGTWRVAHKISNNAFVLGRSFNESSTGTAKKLNSGDCASQGWATLVEKAEVGASYKEAWASDLRQLYSVFGANSANYLEKIWTAANYEGTFAQKITELEANDGTDGGGRAALSQVAQVVAGDTAGFDNAGNFLFPITNGLAAMQYIKTDVNGNVAGYGLYNDGNESLFAIHANKFAITSPNAASSEARVPFFIDGDNTYIESAFIKDASIGSAKIADAAITNAKIASLHAEKITGDVDVYYPVNWYEEENGPGIAVGGANEHWLKSWPLTKHDQQFRYPACNLTFNFLSPVAGLRVKINVFYGLHTLEVNKVAEHQFDTVLGLNCVSINGMGSIRVRNSGRDFRVFAYLMNSQLGGPVLFYSITGCVYAIRGISD